MSDKYVVVAYTGTHEAADYRMALHLTFADSIDAMTTFGETIDNAEAKGYTHILWSSTGDVTHIFGEWPRTSWSDSDEHVHDASAEGTEEGLQRLTPKGDLACNDCDEPMYYCRTYETYFHFDDSKKCFLIPTNHAEWGERYREDNS